MTGKKAARKVRVRRRWSLKPVTRVEKDKTRYNRQKTKIEIKKLI